MSKFDKFSVVFAATIWFILGCGLCGIANGQTTFLTQCTANGCTPSGPAANTSATGDFRNSGGVFLTVTVQTVGTISTCAFTGDNSTDATAPNNPNAVWTIGGIIPSSSCLAPTNFQVAGTWSFGRLNLGAGITGTGTVYFKTVVSSPSAVAVPLPVPGLVIDATQLTGATNNDYCDKVTAAWVLANLRRAGQLVKVTGYSIPDQHCTALTYFHMFDGAQGEFDQGQTRLFVDIVAGVPGGVFPSNPLHWHGMERNSGSAIGASINACVALNNPIAGCQKPTFCSAAGAPIAPCGFNEGGNEQAGTGQGVARSWPLFSITNVPTANTNYLAVVVTLPSNTPFSVQPEENVQIVHATTDPAAEAMYRVCKVGGSPTYPECPSGPGNCTGAGVPDSHCTLNTQAFFYVPNWPGAPTCAATCTGEVIAPTTMAAMGGFVYNVPSSSSFGARLDSLTFNGGVVPIPGLEGPQNTGNQELGWVRDLSATNFSFQEYDFWSTRTQNFGPLFNLSGANTTGTNIYPATAAGSFGFYVRGVDDFTFSNNSTNFTCNVTGAAQATGVVTITYTPGTNLCKPMVHMGVTIVATGNFPAGLLAYVCGPGDNNGGTVQGCIVPTGTQFTYINATNPTGTITAQTQSHVAIFADNGQKVSASTVSHHEGYDWTVMLGANSPSNSSNVSGLVGPPTAAPGIGVVYISNEFQSTTPFTGDYNLQSLTANTALGTIWDMINFPQLLDTDKNTSFYVCDTLASVSTSIYCLSTSLIYPTNTVTFAHLGTAVAGQTRLCGNCVPTVAATCPATAANCICVAGTGTMWAKAENYNNAGLNWYCGD